MVLVHGHASSADGHGETAGGRGREGGQFLFVQGTSVLRGKTEKAPSCAVFCSCQASLPSSSPELQQPAGYWVKGLAWRKRAEDLVVRAGLLLAIGG